MSQAYEIEILFLPRGKLSEVLFAFEDDENITVLALTLTSAVSTKTAQGQKVGPLTVRITPGSVSYLPRQTLEFSECRDLVENYDTYTDELFLLTNEHLLDDERVYVTSLDVRDHAHNWTVRFRVLTKAEREYTEVYQEIIRESRNYFTTALEFDNNLRKQIQNRGAKKATQRVREKLLISDLKEAQLLSRIPHVYNSKAVGRREVTMTQEGYTKMREISDRYINMP